MTGVFRFLRGLIIKPKSGASTADEAGVLEVLSSDNKLRYYNGTSSSPVVTEAHAATLTNKTFDADGTGNVISNIENENIKAAAAIDATKIADGTVSNTEFQYINSLTSNAQTQITAAQNAADTAQTAADDAQTDIDNHISDASGAHAATAISVTPSGNLAATEVQAALVELQGDIDTINSDLGDDVEGPASSTDNAVVRFDGTTGKLIQNSSITIDDTGTLTAGALAYDGMTFNGTTITSATGTQVNFNSNEFLITANAVKQFGAHTIFAENNGATGANATVAIGNAKNILLNQATLTSIDMLSGGNGSSGQEVTLINKTGATITINNLTGATAAQQIKTPTGANVSVLDDSAVDLVFNGDNWTLVGIKEAASAITNTPAGTISATDVQSAINELDGDIQAHISDAAGAHAASAISNSPSGNLAATDVQGALNELQGDINTINTDIADDVEGPASSTDNAVARFDGTTGKLIQNSSVTISDTGVITNGASVIDMTSSDVSVTGENVALHGAITYDRVSDNTATGDAAIIDAGFNKAVYVENIGLNSIGGIDNPLDGQELIITNGTGHSINILNNDVGAAGDGIVTGTGADLALENEASITLTYNSTLSRWYVIGGTGSGGGGASTPDVFVNLDASEQLNTWSSGDNATFLGGGTLAGTFEKETSSPLNGTESYKYTQAAGSANDYLASPVQDVPIRFRGNTVTVHFPYLYNGNNDDITFVLYDVTNATVLTNSAFNSLDATGNNASIFIANVNIPITCEEIRVGFQTLVENSGKILQFDDIQVGSNAYEAQQIANIGEWTSFTPTGTWVANTTYAGRYRQVGDSVEFDVTLTLSGAPTAATLEVTLPNSWTINTSKLSNLVAGVGGTLGFTQLMDDSTSANNTIGSVAYGSSTTVRIRGPIGSVTATSPFTWANLDTVRARFTVPINGLTPYTPTIVASPETFSTDTATLTYAGSASYTLSTLANAPVGTFITYTYAINTNTLTQTTTAPTQTTSDMNTNGINIYTRAYNAASTAGNPTRIAIQIGKGMKGLSLNLYKSTSKTTGGEIDYVCLTDANARGIRLKDYNESTGILILDAGFQSTANTTALFDFSDLTTQGNGYLVINASKNPALTGIGVPRVAARYTSNAGQAISTSATKLTYEDLAFDTHGAYSSGTYTVPLTGYYQVNSAFRGSPESYANGGNVIVLIYVDGVEVRRNINVVENAATSTVAIQAVISEVLYLTKGQTVEIYGISSTATTMSTSPSYNGFSIAKVDN
jgi:hypothetical protein